MSTADRGARPVISSPPASERRVPLSRLPGIPTLALGLATGRPDVSEFLPDRPGISEIVRRAGEVLAAFHSRLPSHSDPAHAELAAGRKAVVFAAQQVGLFTGPLLTLVKAMAATKLSADLSEKGIPSAPAFWCASEDHDLVEVTRVVVPGPNGPRDLGPDPVPLAENRRPVGEMPIELDLEKILREAATGLARPADEQAFSSLRDLNNGQTFLGGFVATLRWILGDGELRFVDAARRGDKPDLVPLAVRLLRERGEVRRLLEERDARLRAKGHSPQVTSDPAALPLFVIVNGERRLLVEEGSALHLKGAAGEWETEAVVAKLESGEWLPSFSALTRPLAASTLYPVAATILGPSEIAYWAQSHPLFSWAGLVPPVLVPRPMVALVSPAARRLLAKLGIGMADVLEGKDALLMRQGAGRAASLLRKTREARDGALSALEALRPDLLGIDPSLGNALETTSEKVRFALDKLAERASAAAGRADETLERQVSRLADELAPEGRPAERIYPPLPWVLQWGREAVVGALGRDLRWDEPGLKVVDL